MPGKFFWRAYGEEAKKLSARRTSLITMLALFAPSTNSFLAGLGAKPKTAPVPMYPGAGSASEVGSTGLPGDIGFDPLVRPHSNHCITAQRTAAHRRHSSSSRPPSCAGPRQLRPVGRQRH